VKILAPRRFPGPAWDELRGVEYYDGKLTGPRPDVDALAVVGDVIDAETLELFPRTTAPATTRSTSLPVQLAASPSRTPRVFSTRRRRTWRSR
jgi:hypothetical protein